MMNFSLLNCFKKNNEETNMDIQTDTIKNEIKKPLCALVIGHKKSSPGAYNEKHDIYEFEFNELISVEIEKGFDDSVDIQRIYRRTYSSLPHDINDLNPDFIISMHCNAFNKKASGCEVLYYHKSQTGLQMAEILQKNFLSHYNNNSKNRGIVPITSEDRGGYLLKTTNAPCIIAEPFFIDNDAECEYAMVNKIKLAYAYIFSIKEISKKFLDLNERL